VVDHRATGVDQIANRVLLVGQRIEHRAGATGLLAGCGGAESLVGLTPREKLEQFLRDTGAPGPKSPPNHSPANSQTRPQRRHCN
jgi:hypothetical protein